MGKIRVHRSGHWRRSHYRRTKSGKRVKVRRHYVSPTSYSVQGAPKKLNTATNNKFSRDCDKDGVPDSEDCAPKDPRKQGLKHDLESEVKKEARREGVEPPKVVVTNISHPMHAAEYDPDSETIYFDREKMKKIEDRDETLRHEFEHYLQDKKGGGGLWKKYVKDPVKLEKEAEKSGRKKNKDEDFGLEETNIYRIKED